MACRFLMASGANLVEAPNGTSLDLKFPALTEIAESSETIEEAADKIDKVFAQYNVTRADGSPFKVIIEPLRA
eukprot:CAMPEP_0196598056 /NCGR_PEP_ID=MMETSP1081-20130531/94096_1 /TAXON_ID=36882 /ORGANISM="Pyramimonas amylifera, Strain CCMP720" /LENGTH=72 /DNA_ID=CAMNT_0041923687 /DNA_START=637 /DNA_END=855 /DNA_ORIENTATION=+